MRFKSFFHILFQHARRGRDQWDEFLSTRASAVCLTAGLAMLGHPSFAWGLIGLAIFSGFLLVVPNTDPALQALRCGTPMQRASAAVVTQHVYSWSGRPKLYFFLVCWGVFSAGLIVCLMQPAWQRLHP